MILEATRQMKHCHTSGTVIVPHWPSALFWPALQKGFNEFESFVTNVFKLPKISDLIIQGPGQKAIYKKKKSVFSGCPKFDIMAIRIKFAKKQI